MKRVRFRPHQSILVAAFIAFVGALPIVFGPDLPSRMVTTATESNTAAFRPLFLPLLLIPIALFLWVLRSGTDVDDNGITVRAVFGKRHIPWWQVRELATDPDGKAQVLLQDGYAVRLPAVRGADLTRIVEASDRGKTAQ